jgi:signal peptidase I
MLTIRKVVGQSLAPEIKEGDFVVIATKPFFFHFLKRGQKVVFHHPQYGRMVKVVEKVLPERGELRVIGTHPESVDSRHFGPIPVGSLEGIVLWHLKSH